ncbi:sporulation protein YtfJ [Myxococcota bacterium]|nr:sporulation protein YtfJ [Myxococcota bacterium]MBU1430229.1 sporulation protein YtfJ [Myxococcota bacterium]MBU1898700.1 sporulation protein YtfJ [Myxococcota bacterium]
MKHVTQLLNGLLDRLKALGARNAVVAPPISLGERHVVPLCEISLGLGGGGGQGEGAPHEHAEGYGKGTLMGGGGGVRTAPIAVLIIDGDEVRVEALG